MHYVKQFNINGVDTKQVACIELPSAPNAATEGAVGLLAMDMSSFTHDVYKCVALNGSIYTWELLSSGMSILSANITGEGGKNKSFPYTNITRPKNYLIKRGDLIIDSEGYIYQVIEIDANACATEYTGTHLGGASVADKDYRLNINYDKLQLVTDNGSVLSQVDMVVADGTTIGYEPISQDHRVIGVYSTNNVLVRFFVGTQAQYDALTENQKKDLYPLITDDTTKAEIATLKENVEQLGENVTALTNWKNDLQDGLTQVPKANRLFPGHRWLELKSGIADVSSWGVDCLYIVWINDEAFIIATNASGKGESAINANNLRITVNNGKLTYETKINGVSNIVALTETCYYAWLM